jgi:hypothetical protein
VSKQRHSLARVERHEGTVAFDPRGAQKADLNEPGHRSSMSRDPRRAPVRNDSGTARDHRWMQTRFAGR